MDAEINSASQGSLEKEKSSLIRAILWRCVWRCGLPKRGMPRHSKKGNGCWFSPMTVLFFGLGVLFLLQSFFLARVWLRHPDVIAAEVLPHQ